MTKERKTLVKKERTKALNNKQTKNNKRAAEQTNKGKQISARQQNRQNKSGQLYASSNTNNRKT